MADLTITLSEEKWIEIRSALIHTAGFDNDLGAHERANELMRTRQEIINQTKRQRGGYLNGP